MLHLPIAGQVASLDGAGPATVQATLVMLHLSGMLAHGTFELQAACVLAHAPLLEQSLLTRHGTVGSFAQVPMIGAHCVSTVHAFPKLLQVPKVRHCAALAQGFCDHGCPFAFEH
jgi:hypothetical protein